MSASILKQTYDAVALFALLNVIAFVGILAFLVTNRVVDAEKVQRIAAVIRGDEAEKEPETVTQESEPASTAEKALARRSVHSDLQTELEVMRREEERIKEELRQRLALNNSILLKVTAERERFQQERDVATKRDEATSTRRQTVGFKKQIAIFEGLAPKVALQHLLGMESLDEAARILLEMQTSRAKKIVEAAKRGDNMKKMQAILQLVREVAPNRSSELATD